MFQAPRGGPCSFITLQPVISPFLAGCGCRTYAAINFPADDLAAEDIHDQIEIEEHACHWPGHPRDVPGPDLTWRTGQIAGRWFAPDWGLGSATVMLLIHLNNGSESPRPPLTFGGDYPMKMLSYR